MGKERVNWTIEPICMKILKQAKKLNPRQNVSFSYLVEYAIKKTYQNKVEALRSENRDLQMQIMKNRDIIKVLEENKKDEGI